MLWGGVVYVDGEHTYSERAYEGTVWLDYLKNGANCRGLKSVEGSCMCKVMARVMIDVFWA